MSAYFSVMSNYNSKKVLLFTLWFLIAFKINVCWLIEQKIRNHLSITIAQLSFVNVFVTLICVGVELIWNICIEWPASNLICKIIKWLQTTSLMLSTGFILQTIILFKYPEQSRKRIKKKVYIIWIVSLFFASPQLLIFGSYTVEPNNSTQCTVDRYVPEAYEGAILYLKIGYYAGPVIILLVAHSLLCSIFMGKKTGIFWNKHAEEKWRMMKSYLMMVFYTYCAFLALSVLSLRIPHLRIVVEYFHLALLQSGCVFSTLNPFLLRKILEKSASVETVPDQRYDGIPSSPSSSSSSSSSPPLNPASIQLSNDPPSSLLDSVSVPLSDNNYGIPSSPPLSSLDSVSVPLSYDNDGIPSSSPPPPLHAVSIRLSDDPPPSSLDSVSVPLSDDNDGISSSS